MLPRERGKALFLVKVWPCEAGRVFGDIQHIDLTVEPEEGYRRLRIGLLGRGLDPLDIPVGPQTAILGHRILERLGKYGHLTDTMFLAIQK